MSDSPAGRRKAWQGCGCVLAVIIVLFGGILAGLFYTGGLPFKREPARPSASGGELSVHVLDVGQGDAIVIRGPDGKTALIDAGDNRRGKIVLEYLRSAGITKLDYLFVTHAHADHIGGADEVVAAVPIGAAITAGVAAAPEGVEPVGKRQPAGRRAKGRAPEPGVRDQFLAAAAARNLALEEASPGAMYDLGGGARLQVLAPSGPSFTSQEMRLGGNVPNANSMVLRLEYGEFAMLLTGDAEAQTEQRLIASGANLTASIIKISHHGSEYATSGVFLEQVAPQAAIISAAADNRYGHPSQAVLDRLSAKQIKLYRTDLQGNVSIVTTGKGFKIEPDRESTKEKLAAGREKLRDDSTRSGFIAYGDFGPHQPTR